MKFGNHLNSQKSTYPDAWKNSFIDYLTLKLYIKNEILVSSLRFDIRLTPHNSTDDLSPFAGNIALQASQRLSGLADRVKKFFEMLDSEVSKLTKFYEEQEDAIAQAASDANSSNSTNHQSILSSIVLLEKFILLNYTGLTKILKKFDKLSGLGSSSISDAYIWRLTQTRFYRGETLSLVKKNMIHDLAGIQSNGNTENAASQPANGRPALLSPTQKKIGSQADLLDISSIPTESSSSSSVPLLREGKSLTSWFPPASLLPSQRILITLSGPHGTDILSALLSCIAAYNCKIEDFSFSRLYHNVTFAVLIRLSSDVTVDMFKKLAANAKKWEATLQFETFIDGASSSPTTLPASLEDAPYLNRTKYAATVLNQNGLTASFLNDFTSLLLQFKVSVERLSRMNSGAALCCVDYKLSVPKEIDIDEFRKRLFEMSGHYGTDVSLQEFNVFRRNKRLVVFDMDSTLIQQEVIDEIAKFAGVVDKVAEITHLAMAGDLPFTESLRRRVALLKGTPTSVLDQVRERLTFTEGAKMLCRCLKKLGFKLAVISGGFMPLATYVKNELGLDYAFANQLKTTPDNRYFTGETVGPIVSGERKAELLEVIAQAESISLEQVIAIGDGANDLWMLSLAGLGIAFNAKPRVQEKARTRINQKSLAHVLYLLGYTDEDIRELI
ncbi:HAD-like domain-containing protein [Paraphysoderma sedebokerense]|nr:HAD-like domain-containing protein [Paraphysoderma sedebokerense]